MEYNVFDSISTKAEDCGVISTGETIGLTDNIIRYNIIKNSGELGIYLDCGASGQEVSGNVFYNCGIAQNGGTENIINGNVFIGKDNIGSTGRAEDDPATTYMSGNVTIGDEFDFEKLGTVGENNMEYKKNENPMFVNPSIGDYRVIEGKGFYDIPYEKIGRY